MDLNLLQKELQSAGFLVEIGDIKLLSGLLKRAIADGSVKQSTAPNHECYPIGQIISLILGKNPRVNSQFWWNKAVNLAPELEFFRHSASYSNNITQQKKIKNGVASLKFAGVVALASVLGFAPSHENALESAAEPSVAPSGDRIYVLKDLSNKLLKIGITNDVETRIKAHRVSNLYLVPFAFFAVNSRDREYELHQLLQTYRVVGAREWYHDTPTVRRLIFDYFIDD